MTPAVFAVAKEYQIMLPVEFEATMWVKVGDKNYYDHSNGVLRSNNYVHKVSVPMEVLDEHESYTVCLRKIVNRKPYFTETEEIEETTYRFYPVRGERVRAYHISDAHNSIEEPIKAAKAYGDIDFLILNGDIPDHCGNEKNVITIYKIISKLTHGTIPVVFSRGNHDMRGKYAEKFAEYTPCYHGCSYYTFRLGHIWGMVLDCGEDKLDTHEEYGHTVCCHAFREQETEFSRQVIGRAEEEYESDGVTHKLIVVHNPFTRQREDGIFKIEDETYRLWTGLIREHIKPAVILSGHWHSFGIYHCGGKEDSYGQPCPVVVGTDRRKLKEDKLYFGGAGLQFEKNSIKVSFTSNQNENEERMCIDL